MSSDFRVDHVGLGEIGRDHFGQHVVVALELKGLLLEFVQSATDEHDVEAAFGELLGVGFADTVRASRHDGPFTVRLQVDTAYVEEKHAHVGEELEREFDDHVEEEKPQTD